MDEEYLDLVDENDQVIDKKLRSEVYSKKLSNFRAVQVFIKNSKGELWIPRRTAHKTLLLNALDYSAAGHVSSGETYDESFASEVQEELNIDISTVRHKLLGHLTQKDGAFCFQQVYEIKSDVTPNYNPDDFSKAFWLTPQEILKRIENGERAKTDMPLLLRRFYL